RLCEGVDPASTFEREFLDYLHKNGHRLPDFAQYLPTPEVHVQTDFYYERQGVPGVCIFIDGPLHDSPTQVAHDHEVRSVLENWGSESLQSVTTARLPTKCMTILTSSGLNYPGRDLLSFDFLWCRLGVCRSGARTRYQGRSEP